MIESILVILLACFIFFSLFQYVNLFASKLILSHSAARAARARSVGFNEWMVRKSALVAAIPASGRRLEPTSVPAEGTFTAALAKGDIGTVLERAFKQNARSQSAAIEVNRVPQFMESVNEPSSRAVLRYERWEDTSVQIKEDTSLNPDSPAMLGVRVGQRHPLLLSLESMEEGEFRPYATPDTDEAAEEDLSIASEYSIESHYPLYLEDAKW